MRTRWKHETIDINRSCLVIRSTVRTVHADRHRSFLAAEAASPTATRPLIRRPGQKDWRCSCSAGRIPARSHNQKCSPGSSRCCAPGVVVLKPWLPCARYVTLVHIILPAQSKQASERKASARATERRPGDHQTGDQTFIPPTTASSVPAEPPPRISPFSRTTSIASSPPFSSSLLQLQVHPRLASSPPFVCRYRPRGTVCSPSWISLLLRPPTTSLSPSS
jgi:hypothetical protein